MLRAISLADTYKYTAKPNPVVGALILKDEIIISEGAHERFGENHAEINAIEAANKQFGKSFESFADLILICTLEPCNHSGKTGPCTKAIIDSGIKKVIIGSEDPNPIVAGKGIDKLIENGINVLFRAPNTHNFIYTILNILFSLGLFINIKIFTTTNIVAILITSLNIFT